MQKNSTFKRLMQNQAAPLVLILIVLLIVTMILSSGVTQGAPVSAMFTQGFMSRTNLRNFLYSIVIQMFMACGIGMLLISGNIDLSVATQASLSVMIFAWLHQNTPLPWIVSILITVGVAICMGCLSTFLVIYRGLCSVMTNGYNITISDGPYLRLGRLMVGGVVPLLFIIALAFIIVFQFILSRTNFGRSVFMTGGNRVAARLAGMNPNRVILILFIISSIMAAFGGMAWVANIGTASPTSIIQDAPDMSVISASILGGISFMGGAGNLIGSLIAILLLNVLENMMNVLGINPYWIVFAQGALLTLALAINFISEQRARRKLLMR